jgi:hypothetical protein
MALTAVRPQVVADDVRREFRRQPERVIERNPAFRTIGNWYHYDFHARTSWFDYNNGGFRPQRL